MNHIRGCPLFTHPTQRPPAHPTDCRCAAIRREPDPTTQNGRVLAFIRSHPGATFVECYWAMDPPIANIRARHSDLRIRGFDIVCEQRADGHEGFTLRAPDEQLALGIAS